MLFVAHRSIYRGGAEDDFERILSFMSHDSRFENYGFLPDGPRVSDYAGYLKDYGLYRIGYFPVIYESFVEYLKYAVKYFIQARQLKKFIGGKSINLAYLNTGVMLWLVLLLKKNNIKVIVNIKETIEPEFIRKFIYRLYSRKCSYFFSVSGYNTEDFKRLTGDDRIMTVYSALEEQAGIPVELEKEIGGLNNSKLNNNTFKLINIAPVCKIKNQKLIAESLTHLKNNGVSDITYVQVGNVPETKYVKQFMEIIRENRLEENVILTGTLNIDVMRTVLKKCDVLIISSLSEGLPLILVEAFKQRIPVISVKNTGMSEIITHLENGLFTESEPEKLGEMIKYLRGNKAVYRKITENAYQVYREKFNLVRNLEKMKAVFDELSVN